jgi:tetratricopeptide (TPR) repeat protein
MEIHIRLAGVQLGPYSEEQVREYLAEGLLSPTDSACAGGAEHWISVTDLLARLAQPSDTSLVPTPAEVGSDSARRAPDAAEGVTQLPTRLSDSKQVSLPSVVSALSKKNNPIGPTAPIIPARPDYASGSGIATTTPLIPTRQATKKVNRASLVKALAEGITPQPTGPFAPSPGDSTADTEAIRAPAQNPDEANGSPDTLPEGKSKPLPPPIKALTAKTVPLRAPALPPNQGKSPVTTPMPTRSSFKASSGTLSSSAVTQSLSKKLGRISLPDAPSETAPAKQEPSKDSSKEKETVKTDAPEEPQDSTSDPDNLAPPRRKRSDGRNARLPIIPIVIGVLAVLAVGVGYFVWSPYHAVTAFRNALNDGIPAELDSTIDFGAVHSSLKDQIRDQLAKANVPNAPPYTPANATPSTMIDIFNNSIDTYLTSDGISNVVNKSGQPETPTTGPTISPATASKILLEFNNLPVKSEGFSGINDFVVDLDAAILHFQLDGFGWKLKSIDLPPAPPASGSSISPVLSPILDTYLEQGSALSQKGDWQGAIDQFSQVLAINPKSSEAYEGRGAARQAKGDLDGAVADYNQALTLDPKMATVYSERGSVKSTRNDWDGAIADFTQAINLDPKFAAAYDGRGNAKTAKEDLDGAIADYTQAITLDPNMASAYADRGFARQANGNLDGAISDYTQALGLNPKMAGAYYNRGLARQSQGNLEAAIIDYDRALAYDPKIAGAYYNRGNAKNANHDLDGAIADFTQAIAINPKIALAYCNRGLARQAKGDLDGALSDYTQALAIDPKIAVAYYDRGLIKEQKNDFDGAIADSSQALDLDPKNAQAYYNRGFAKLTKGNLDGALADLKQFCSIAPNDRNADHARLYLWLISKAQNSQADPDQDLSDTLQNAWNSSGDDMTTKTAAFLLGRLNEADYLASASSTDAKADQGQRCEAWYFAGMKRLLSGDKKGAIDCFQKCIDTNQTDYCEYILAHAELQSLVPSTPAVTPASPTATTPTPAPTPTAISSTPPAASKPPTAAKPATP